ncbi:MAG: 3-methyladenine DNA glycosylase [Chloroflexi bacterium]|nr:3-methyladenine DNA glycosylase [Chloroflexota bacterium]
MNETGFVIPTAPQFDFAHTVLSHGWLMLPPFTWEAESGILEYVYQSASGDVLRLRMRASPGGLRVELPDCEVASDGLRREAAAAVRTMLRLDWDLSAFYAAMAAHEGYHWLESQRRGRILCAPSLWEDLAKVLLTTNCRWSQTVNMCRQLCRLGAPHPTLDDRRAFPTAERIAALSFDAFAQTARAGYRSGYLHELARKVAAGEVDLAAWLALDSDSFYRAVKSLKGFGDYAAGTLARMLGHFDHIAIDSACHAMFAARHNGGLKGSTAEIKAHYARFERWRGLVMWMDIMRHYEE